MLNFKEQQGKHYKKPKQLALEGFLKDLKVKGERQPLSKILTATAEKTMKDAAIAHNDLQMIVAVSETGLIAKEFKNMINAI